jgi:heptosyltransferase II
MRRFLIIQTAFTGDVILATAIAEKLHKCFPDAVIDFLVRKGNHSLLADHPFIREVLVWDKSSRKNKNLLKIIGQVRGSAYTHIINAHRFGSSGLVTWMSGAQYKVGFAKNPFSFCYNKKVSHIISAPYSDNPVHEVTRNQQLIADITDDQPAMPCLYPGAAHYEHVRNWQHTPYITVAPASVWYTKQFPAEKWISLINELRADMPVYLLGGPGDKTLAENIRQGVRRNEVLNLCGELSFLESAALMKGALMNYTNDSAPLHMATAVNAPATAVFCSTVPAFGFGPLRENGKVVEINERLYCRPCGLHGHRQCPEGHFKCAFEINNEQLLWWTSKTT